MHYLLHYVRILLPLKKEVPPARERGGGNPDPNFALAEVRVGAPLPTVRSALPSPNAEVDVGVAAAFQKRGAGGKLCIIFGIMLGSFCL